jgi:hypothetical protein
MTTKLASNRTGTSRDGDASSGISGAKWDWRRWPGGPHPLRVECVGDREQRSATGGPRRNDARWPRAANGPAGRRQNNKPPGERRAKRRAARQRGARTAKTNKQTNKQTNGPTGNDAPAHVGARRQLRARACACTSVRGCVGGRGVRVPLRARFSRRGALQCLRLLRGARDVASPVAIGGVRRRRGRILHRHTPRRCACVRACVRACARACVHARVSVCARSRVQEREAERERVCACVGVIERV